MVNVSPELLVRLQRPTAHLYPFDEGAAQLPLLDVPLAEYQAREAERAGFTLIDLPPDVALPPSTRAFVEADAVFSAETLIALRQSVRGAPVRAAVLSGTALYDFTAPLCPEAAPEQDLPLPLWFGPLEGRSAASWMEQALALLPVCDETEFTCVRVPPLGSPPHELRIPVVHKVGGRFAHWLHVLNLNQVLLEHERRRRGAVGARNVISGDVTCHPSALVEGSLLSHGVEIDHAASVIDCFLGEDVKIGDHAVFHRCVIGKGCHTLIDTHMRRVVAFSGSTLSNLGVEDLLIGRDVFITTAVAYFDDAPRENVVVDGQDTRRPSLSGAIGNRCILGARALFAQGIAVPSGTVIVMRPDEGATKLDARGLARASMQIGNPQRDY